MKKRAATKHRPRLADRHTAAESATIAELRAAVAAPHRLAVVVGTGVSIGCCQNQQIDGFPIASWKGLIGHGINRCAQEAPLDDELAEILRRQAASNDIGQLTQVAESITEKLTRKSEGVFARWLKETVGSLEAKTHEVVEAIADLGGIMATLNYDTLIEQVTGRTSVPWDDVASVEAILRYQKVESCGDDVDGVLHLHGHWQKPESVVLGLRSYDRVKDDPHAAAVLHLFAIGHTLLFVGCKGTVQDPNFTRLTEWISRARHAATARHFLLHHRGETNEIRELLRTHASWLTPICYGETHGDLAGFLANLRPANRKRPPIGAEFSPRSTIASIIPPAPEFFASPDYIGNHAFVGRVRELGWLDQWAQENNPNSLLIFEAIGGTGKSMVTWHWTKQRATSARSDWAGRFWYSFYERGAQTADFCSRALAYMTGSPVSKFEKRKTAELTELLLHELRRHSWLIVLDGLERVLTVYNRFDASQLRDEDADAKRGETNSDDYACIRDEDDELLRALTQCRPSKILATTRNTPRALVNSSGQLIPGAERIQLQGLYPEDAEALLRQADIRGDSSEVRRYLQDHCGGHPLTVGVIAGLVAFYPRDPGNFDLWSQDPAHGGHLNLGVLDLVQKRNHILLQALDSVAPLGRQLLSCLSLISESVDYATIEALNPHAPPPPVEVIDPKLIQGHPRWIRLPEKRKAAIRNARLQFENEFDAWKNSPAVLSAPQRLEQTIADLRRRGLLQFDFGLRAYNLHPVVRGVVIGKLNSAEKNHAGGRVVDHFSRRADPPYDRAETLDDLRNGLHVMRTLLHMGRMEQAAYFYEGGMARALLFNLEARREALALLKPFFPTGWSDLPSSVEPGIACYLSNDAGLCLDDAGNCRDALSAHSACLRFDLEAQNWTFLCTRLNNCSYALEGMRKYAQAERCVLLELELATLIKDDERVFVARLRRFQQLRDLGKYDQADALWPKIDKMGRNWSRASYRAGAAEQSLAILRFRQGRLTARELDPVEELAIAGRNRTTIRWVHWLRGALAIQKGDWSTASANFQNAVRMARESGDPDTEAEAQLALAKLRCGKQGEALSEAERLCSLKWPPHLAVAELLLALGDKERAARHAHEAFRRACAQGEPYVSRYRLEKASALLAELGQTVPSVPQFDRASYEKLEWEDTVSAALAKLRAGNATSRRRKTARRRSSVWP